MVMKVKMKQTQTIARVLRILQMKIHLKLTRLGNLNEDTSENEVVGDSVIVVSSSDEEM